MLRTPSDLLGAIRVLADRARQAGADATVVGTLEETSDRLGWLYANRYGDPEPLLDPAEPLDLPTLEGPEDIPVCLQKLALQAQSQGVDAELTGYVETVGRRVARVLEGGKNLREAPRRPVHQPAELEVKGQVQAATVLDRSLLGFGVLTSTQPPVEKGEAVRLFLNEQGRLASYDCLVVYCAFQAERAGYRLGLDLFSDASLEDDRSA